MKKVFFALVALVASMSMNAQGVKLMKGDVVVATYTADEVDKVVFGEVPSDPTTGTTKATINGEEVDVTWVQLWKNGPKFAAYNVGVTDGRAESYGGYYCWGKAIDKDPNKAYKEGMSDLTGDDDTATKLWGSNWRMPTKAEFDKLLINCDVAWTNDYNGTGVAGCIITGTNDYASNSIFLPAAGYCDYDYDYDYGDVDRTGNVGYYWSSTPFGSDNAYNLNFSSDEQFVDFSNRGFGFSVRAVLVEDSTTGTAKRTGNYDVTWVQLWENGPKFAEYNVGVTDDQAESYGGYYCWGKAIDKDSNNAYKEGTSALTGDDDTATNLWGNNWRMPTQAELRGLLDNCDVVWTTVGGKNGCKFTGKGDYSSNSIFLPAAGDCYDGNVRSTGSFGYYWSSTPFGSDDAYNLHFYSDYQDVSNSTRDLGYSVRAVLKE